MTTTDALQPAQRVAEADGLTHWYGEHTAQLGGVTYTVRAHAAMDDPKPLYVKPTVTDDYIQVDLVDSDGVIYGWQVQSRMTAAPMDDEAQSARKRAEAVTIAQGALPTITDEDAGRIVDALISAGWGPAPVAEPENWGDWPEGDDD